MLLDDTRPLGAHWYERTLTKIVRWARAKGATAGFHLGSVGEPGISDLDVLLVFPDGLPVRWQISLSREEAYVLKHSPFAVRRSCLSLVPWVFHLESPRRLFGDLELADTPAHPDLRRNLAVAHALSRLLSPPKTARSALLTLWAARHNWLLLGLRPPDVFRELGRLREEWFTLGQERHARLLDLVPRVLSELSRFVLQISGRESHRPFQLGPWLFVPGRELQVARGPGARARISLPPKVLGEVRLFAWRAKGVLTSAEGLRGFSIPCALTGPRGRRAKIWRFSP